MPTEILNKGEQASQEDEFEDLFESCRSSEVGAIKAWYASDFEKRLTEITEVIKTEIAEQLRGQFSRELENRVASLRGEYEKRLQAANRNQPSNSSPELSYEIAAVQADLDKKEADLANSLTDDSFSLGVILRMRNEKMELSSYLKGLNFCAKAIANRG